MNMLPYSGIPALPKNIEDMHNQLVTLGLNDVRAMSARISKCEAWVDTVEETEQTGNPVEYQNALALPAKSLSVNLEPIQDLHCYDKPWVGGADVNKLPYFSDTTSGSIVMTVGDDGVLSFSGTSGATASIIGAFDLSLPTGTYTMADFAPNASPVYLQIYNVTTSTLYWVDTTKTFTHNGTDSLKARIWVKGDSTALNHTLKPMVVTGSTAPTSYAPYSNICPISGRTSVTITDVDAESHTATVTVAFEDEHGDPITVYGGSLNLTTGVLTIDKVSTTYINSTDFTYWGDSSGYGKFTVDLPDGARVLPTNTLSNMFPVKDSTHWETPDGDALITGLSAATGNRIGLLLYGITSKDGLGTFLAANNMQICYPLATPTTIQLTAEQLQMFKGYNQISSDDGDITVTAYTGDPWEPITRAIKKVTNKTKTTKKRRK